MVEDPRRQFLMLATNRADFATFSQLTAWHILKDLDIPETTKKSFTFTQMIDPFQANLAFLKDSVESTKDSSRFNRESDWLNEKSTLGP